MSNPTPAQEEFAAFLAKNSDRDDGVHPEDRDYEAREAADQSEDEEERYRAEQIEAAMRMPTLDNRTEIRLPPASFDNGRSTGVKGVIADARSYETARRSKWKDRAHRVRNSVFGLDGFKNDRSSGPDSDGSGTEDPDEAAFLEQWRESRKRELEEEARNGGLRSRRTSPSVRMYGRFDTVDALGYLDAIEKVTGETTVVVFVYDHEVCIALFFHGSLTIVLWLTSLISPWYRLPSSKPCGRSYTLTPKFTSSRSTTRTSTSTTPLCRPSSHTGTRAISLPT